MVKTHDSSFFVLYTLDGIRNSFNIVLQVLETQTIDATSQKPLYLCEVVNPSSYHGTRIETVAGELVRVNKERDSLLRKIDRQNTRIQNLEAIITRMKSEQETPQ